MSNGTVTNPNYRPVTIFNPNDGTPITMFDPVDVTISRAVQNVVTEASKTLRNIRSIYVKEFTASVENEKVTSYRINAKVTFEMERFGHNADRQNAELPGCLGDDRRRASAGAATHSGGDENHVRTGQVIADFVDHFIGRGAPHIRLRSGAEAFGRLHAHLDDAFGFRHRERLRVGIGDDKIDALEAGSNHIVDGVAARAAHSEYSDPGFELTNIRDVEIDGHDCLFFLARARSTP